MSTRHVLIIDDHPLFRDAIKGVLGSVLHGANMHEASSLEEGIGILGTDDEFELVLLDLKMPGVQGLSGLAFFRAQFPAVPVVVVSGQEEPAVIRRALSLGASGFIPKSSSADDMRKAVLTVLEGEIWAPTAGQASSDEEREIDELSRRLATLTPQQSVC
jgi:DNA-binding NarL/FixJ family response regulator